MCGPADGDQLCIFRGSPSQQERSGATLGRDKGGTSPINRVNTASHITYFSTPSFGFALLTTVPWSEGRSGLGPGLVIFKGRCVQASSKYRKRTNIPRNNTLSPHSPRQKSISISTSHTSPLLTEFILESMYPTMFLWPERSRCKINKFKA